MNATQKKLEEQEQASVEPKKKQGKRQSARRRKRPFFSVPVRHYVSSAPVDHPPFRAILPLRVNIVIMKDDIWGFLGYLVRTIHITGSGLLSIDKI